MLDKDGHALVEKRSGRSYRVGDEVEVEVAASDPARRRIDLAIVEGGKTRAPGEAPRAKGRDRGGDKGRKGSRPGEKREEKRGGKSSGRGRPGKPEKKRRRR